LGNQQRRLKAPLPDQLRPLAETRRRAGNDFTLLVNFILDPKPFDHAGEQNTVNGARFRIGVHDGLGREQRAFHCFIRVGVRLWCVDVIGVLALSGPPRPTLQLTAGAELRGVPE
jgi:hypothetical protein